MKSGRKVGAFAGLMAAVLAAAVIAAGRVAMGQGAAVPATTPADGPAVAPEGPPVPVELSPDALEILTMLQDRKNTLKDFTSGIAYGSTDRSGLSTTTRTGTLSYISDPKTGPMFSADFTLMGTGEHMRTNHVQFIFDGHVFTLKDFAAKEFVHSTLVKPGDPPGSATTLGGPMPLPIGLDVKDVARNFNVSVESGGGAGDGDQAVLKLVPRVKGSFEYASLEVTVDKKNQVPVKLVEDQGSKGVTTFEFTNIKVNPGNAKMLDTSTPASEGWTERK